MKARAGLFTLLICMMCLVGFGATTADPDQNSTADYEAFYDVDSSVSVAIVSNLSADKLEINTMGLSCMECHFETLEGAMVFGVGKVVRVDEPNFNYTNLSDVPITDTKELTDFKHRLYQRAKENREQFISLYSTHINQITRIPQFFHNS